MNFREVFESLANNPEKLKAKILKETLRIYPDMAGSIMVDADRNGVYVRHSSRFHSREEVEEYFTYVFENGELVEAAEWLRRHPEYQPKPVYDRLGALVDL